MTEAEWLTSTNPVAMLSFVAAAAPPVRLSPRRVRLFLVGCCRRHWPLFDDPVCRLAVEVAEQFADRQTTARRLSAAQRVLRGRLPGVVYRPGDIPGFAIDVSSAAYYVASGNRELYEAGPDRDHPRLRVAELLSDLTGIRARSAAGGGASQAAWDAERRAQADLLRCVAGNPFRPAAFDARWRTSTAVTLAEGIYAERAFDRLPVLADALEEAGCDNADVLEHCRAHPEHARGCWVVDAVLGKK